MPVLDVRRLGDDQLEAVRAVFHQFKDIGFDKLHMCADDAVRREVDERLCEALGLGESGRRTVARLRDLLANEPSIHGSNRKGRYA